MGEGEVGVGCEGKEGGSKEGRWNGSGDVGEGGVGVGLEDWEEEGEGCDCGGVGEVDGSVGGEEGLPGFGARRDSTGARAFLSVARAMDLMGVEIGP